MEAHGAGMDEALGARQFGGPGGAVGGPGNNPNAQNNPTTASATASTTDAATITTSDGLGGATTLTSVAAATDTAATTQTTAASETGAATPSTTDAAGSVATNAASSGSLAGTAAGQSTSTATPLTTVSHAKSGGLSGGAMAAAVIVPILVALALLAFGLLYLRRKRRTDSNSSSALDANEKYTDVHARAAPSAPPMAGGLPILTSARNNTYYTGLDTPSTVASSIRSGTDPSVNGEWYTRSDASVPAPPPYLAAGGPMTPHSVSIRSAGSTNSSNFPTVHEPYDLIEGVGAALLPQRPSTSRTTGSSASTRRRSFSSALYSESASVHSARAGRVSVGAAHLVKGWNREEEESLRSGQMREPREEEEDPFHDPGSPVSSITATMSSGASVTSAISEEERGRGRQR